MWLVLLDSIGGEMSIRTKTLAEIKAEPDIAEAQPREITDSLLTGLEALAKAAYPYAWIYAADGDSHVTTGDDMILVDCDCSRPLYGRHAVDNAKFIAAAQPAVVLGMIAKIRELEAKLEGKTC